MKSIFQSNHFSWRQNSSPQHGQQGEQQPFFGGQGAPFIQPKLAIGTPDDAHEREADAVAERVVQQPSNQPTAASHAPAPVQRACEACAQEEQKEEVVQEKIQRQPVDAGVPPPANPGMDAGPTDAGVDLPAGVPDQAPAPDPLAAQKTTLQNEIAENRRILMDLHWYDLDAHPLHKMKMWEQIIDVLGQRVHDPLLEFSRRGDAAGTDADLLQIRTELATFAYETQLTLRIEISRIIEQFKLQEYAWLVEFMLHDTEVKDPVSFNRSVQKAALEFDPNFYSLIKVVTRVSYVWQRTPAAAAAAAGIPDWTEAEKSAYKTAFQRQLNTVWNSQNQAISPFKVVQPQDYLLKNEPIKWSDLYANMQGEVQDVNDPASPGSGKAAHFTITVNKRTAAEGNLRAEVRTGAATFYTGNETAGYDAQGASVGQHTLAHEWMHMIGQPDEYPENSAAQSQAWTTANALGNETGLGSDQWAECRRQLILRNMPFFGAGDLAQWQQDQQDLNNLTNQYGDSDPATAGNQYNIYNVSGNVPNECYAVRGAWSGPGSVRLRPGSMSERGGSHISQNQMDEQRLSDEGNVVHPYHREGVLVETNNLLQNTFEPDVQLEHNILPGDLALQVELNQVRLNNLLRDLGWL